ncbi:hypothetical protein OTU49_012629 [Cherax quadricarinatus]|uniref:Uncharacterized protein n=1 Tax=Cherax quadricarinatus TaxID=27406 RepID=A0AAW0VXQ8_CHEQU
MAKHILSPMAKHILSPMAKHILSPMAKHILSPMAKHILSPMAKHILSPMAKHILSPMAKHIKLIRNCVRERYGWCSPSVGSVLEEQSLPVQNFKGCINVLFVVIFVNSKCNLVK